MPLISKRKIRLFQPAYPPILPSSFTDLYVFDWNSPPIIFFACAVFEVPVNWCPAVLYDNGAKEIIRLDYGTFETFLNV